MIKSQSSLKKKKQTADIISLIVMEFKDEFKNLSIDTLKNDYKTLELLIKTIDSKFSDPKLYDPSNGEIDKNDILAQLLKSIFPDLSDSEIAEFEKATSYIVQGIEKDKGFFSSCLRKTLKILK